MNRMVLCLEAVAAATWFRRLAETNFIATTEHGAQFCVTFRVTRLPKNGQIGDYP